jgi:hypothetical protein
MLLPIHRKNDVNLDVRSLGGTFEIMVLVSATIVGQRFARATQYVATRLVPSASTCAVAQARQPSKAVLSIKQVRDPCGTNSGWAGLRKQKRRVSRHPTSAGMAWAHTDTAAAAAPAVVLRLGDDRLRRTAASAFGISSEKRAEVEASLHATLEGFRVVPLNKPAS